MPRVVKKNITQSRKDIEHWRNALSLAMRAEDPMFNKLQDIYNEVADDALLSSQISNRHEATISSPFELVKDNGKVDEKQTAALNEIPCLIDIFKAILDSELYGGSLVELSTVNGCPAMDLIPRQNIDFVNGRFYPDYAESRFIDYRRAREYGNFIIELYSGHVGSLNKVVRHVLFKKFAQSCWSELCEIYGIPPRYIKTNTQDQAMLDRAESMMKDMGAAAAFVIDTTEEFSFAQGINTNGDVYANLIRLCNNEVSLVISGAIIGQDTENGNYSKELASLQILDRLVNADKRLVEIYMNTTVIPALAAIGWIPQTSARFRFSAVENTEKTWTIVKDLMPYKEVDNDFITEKFGVPVKNKDVTQSLSAPVSSFFV